jgi:hypothetical protein
MSCNWDLGSPKPFGGSPSDSFRVPNVSLLKRGSTQTPELLWGPRGLCQDLETPGIKLGSQIDHGVAV